MCVCVYVCVCVCESSYVCVYECTCVRHAVTVVFRSTMHNALCQLTVCVCACEFTDSFDVSLGTYSC